MQMLGIIEDDDYFDLFEEEWIIVWSTLSLTGIVDEMYHIIFLENVWGLSQICRPPLACPPTSDSRAVHCVNGIQKNSHILLAARLSAGSILRHCFPELCSSPLEKLVSGL